MVDTYANYAALAAAQQLGVDYRLLERSPAGSRLVHLAIHGGDIEPGTTEIADYLAASTSKYYSLDGMKPSGNDVLHLVGTSFDEPQALALVASCDYVIAWNVVDGTDPITHISGLDTEVSQRVSDALAAAGFAVDAATVEGDGNDPLSITNKGSRSMGVQLELSLAQMQSFFTDFTRSGRDSGLRTADFSTYIAAIQTALLGLDAPGRALGTTSLGQVATPSMVASQSPGDFGIPVLSPLTVDGIPMSALQDALRINQGTAQVASGGERFWSSPPRPSGDRLREVYEFSLPTDRLVNRLSFSLARFPQRAWVQYRGKDGVWYPVQRSTSSAPVQLTIQDSLPGVVPAGVVDATKLHPQHFGAGHWMEQLVDVAPVTASRFRIVMVRIPSGGVPLGNDGQPVPYSLGVKDVVASYRATSLDDLPWLPQQDSAHSVALAGSQDLLGSQVDFVVRRTRAGNAGSSDGGVWRCAPQPVPNAVVNLFLDLRTPEGKPQVVDRLSLDPVTSGPTVNLYYAEEDLAEDNLFAPADQVLTFPMARPTTDGVETSPQGVLFPDATAALDIDNRAIQFDPYSPFLLAMRVNPQFDSLDSATYTVVDNGVLKVSVTAGQVEVDLGDRRVELAPVDFSYNSQLPVAVAYDGQTLTVRTPWETKVQDHAYVVPGTPPTKLRLGNALDPTAPGGLLRLTHLFLAKGRAEDIAGIEGYWNDPSGYGLDPGYGADASLHTCANAILRLDASLITAGADSVCPWGLIGGPGVRRDDLVWTPISGDFTVRKGLLKFRPVFARYIKMEFTNLQPMQFSPSQTPPLVTVQLFPTTTAQGGSTVASASTQTSGAAPAGALVAVNQGIPYEYADAARISAAAPASTGAYLPTEALYAPDPLDAQALRRGQSNFPYMPLPGTTAPRFGTTGVHRYHLVQVAFDTKTAYTVALNQVLAYQSDPVPERDAEQYIELFHDTAFLFGYSDGDPQGWQHDASGMTSPALVPWSGVRISSKTMLSRRRVMGLQIATQQSNAVQMVKDSEFDDGSLHYWRPVGDAFIEASDQYVATIGKMARITRGLSSSSWDAMETQFPTWGDIEGSDPLPYRPLWSELEGLISSSSNGGIESLYGVTPAPAGRLYAAARVYTESALTQPLLLQLVNGDGRVLAESQASVKAAQVTEWYVDTTVHSLAPTGGVTWSSVAGSASTWDDMEALGSWGDITQDWDVDNVYDVRVRLIQDGANGTDQWLVDSLAIYNDPTIWEVSRDGGITWYEVLDIRSNPRGVFTFPELPLGDRSGGVQLRWRVTAYAPGVNLSSVVIRPWYASLTGAVPYQDTLQASGSPTSLADYYPPIDQDPYFQGWPLPIPQDWWLASRKWLQLTSPAGTALPAITLPDALVEGTDEGAPPSLPPNVLPDAIVIH